MSDQQTIPEGWDKPEAYFDLWEKHHLGPIWWAYLKLADPTEMHGPKKPCGCLLGALWIEVMEKTWTDAEMLETCGLSVYADLETKGFPREFLEGLDIGFSEGMPFDEEDKSLSEQGKRIGIAVSSKVLPNHQLFNDDDDDTYF